MTKKTANILKIVGIAVGAVGVVATGIVVANKFLTKKKAMHKFEGVTEDDLADILPDGVGKVVNDVAETISDVVLES